MHLIVCFWHGSRWPKFNWLCDCQLIEFFFFSKNQVLCYTFFTVQKIQNKINRNRSRAYFLHAWGSIYTEITTTSSIMKYSSTSITPQKSIMHIKKTCKSNKKMSRTILAKGQQQWCSTWKSNQRLRLKHTSKQNQVTYPECTQRKLRFQDGQDFSKFTTDVNWRNLITSHFYIIN